jgi:intracellular multiplication protein IcmQ
MKDDITEEQANAILKALDKALADGPWEDSNFLRVIAKNLKKIRDDFANEIISAKAERANARTSLTPRVAQRTDQQEVYVSLYTTGGGVPQAWERVIANLPRQIISRPVYANEEDVQQLIKSKENKINEAYVAIFINQSDILNPATDKIPKDRFGKPLLMLKDKAIDLLNVNRFVHSSGDYTLVKGRLVKKLSSDV